MADPTNPTGAGGPPSGGGGAPLDPGMANVFEKMAGLLAAQNVTLDASEKTLKKMAEHAGAIADETEEASGKLKDHFRLYDDIVAKYKTLVSYAKKRSDQDDKQFKDAKKAKKEVEEIVKLHKLALKGAKETSAQYKQMNDNLGRAEKLLAKMKGSGELLKEEFEEVADLFERVAHDATNLEKSLDKLGRHGAALKGFSGILGSMGMGKFTRPIERKMEQAQEIREKVKESRELRKKAVYKHMSEKRENAVAEAKEKGINLEAGAGGDKGREWLANKMGFKSGTDKFKNFISGEAKGGDLAGGAEGVAWKGAMSEGGGAIEGFMSTFETGIEGLMGAMEGLALPLMAVAGVVMLLIAAFDSYATANKDIEKNLGKAGLFTQPGMSAGDAFAAARIALNPNVSGRGIALGVTQERNMALAGSMANAGYNVTDSFKGPNTANEQPGAGGAFMKGNLGEMQRIVMGVSRVAGLTDAEGTENLIKLLQEYRETMASSEDFMTTLNKDTQAAGISTTKYLKIIDQVSSHFDKMSKSLEQVTGVMRELSRYGAVSSESLKDMMDFLGSQGQTSLGTMPQSIFSNMMMPKEILKSMRGGEGAAVDSSVQAINDQFERLHMTGLNLTGLSPEERQAAISQKRQEAMGVGGASGQQLMVAFDKLQDAMLHQKTVGKDAMGRSGLGAMYGEDLIQRTGLMFSKLDEITGRAGVSVSDFMQGNMNGPQAIQIAQEAEMLGIKDPTKARDLLNAEAQNRLADVGKAETPEEARRKLIKSMLNAIKRDPKGLQMTLKGSQWEGFTGSIDELGDDMAKNGKAASAALSKSTFAIAGSVDNQVAVTDKMRMEQKTGILAQKDALDTASDIGSRTQTVEDILKNVFKPLLVDLVIALEFIANIVGKALGKDFELNQKQVKSDMANIPDAMKDLKAKSEELIKQQDELGKKKEAGTMTADEKATFDKNAETLKNNTKTMQYLNDSLTIGVKTGTEQALLEDTLKGIKGYIKGGGAAPTAPSAENLEPSTWKTMGTAAVKGMAGPLGLIIGGVISDALHNMGGTTNIYGSDTTQNLAIPNSPATANEGASNVMQQPPPKYTPRRPMDDK